ncbi:cupin domain-containing protein [Microvirga mediterraneensis]|uniref:Cupin domain-containing protein n=1 Tax=Microvirga mediterraneensis TaxID=2754695 RepID=A0A838BJJ3_9HYPH|nr:cupin domain-containing protein [Microvirga mediterraneensis]MBA1155668.1 cupin domain-containing protein [Microvirga mediterraneensis]
MTDPQTDTYFLAGILLRFLVRDPAAGYCLVEGLVAPGAGPPPNRHPGDDEAFYVLDGTFEFGIGGETRVATAGDFVRIPRGEVHTFRNVGPAPARTLILNAPGTAHVGFFSQAGQPMPPGTSDLPSPSGPPDVARLLEIGRRNGIEFLVPQH